MSLTDYFRGRLPGTTPAGEFARVGDGLWRVELPGEAPVLVTSGPVPLDPRGLFYRPVGVSAFALRAGDGRGEVAGALAVGPAEALQLYLVGVGYAHAGWVVAERGGVKAHLGDWRLSDAVGAAPLWAALARAAAGLAAERGAGTTFASRPLRAAPDEAAALDAALARAGYRPVGGDPDGALGLAGVLWARRGAPARRGHDRPPVPPPLDPRDAAWFAGAGRALRELLSRTGGDDALEAALDALDRWRAGTASGADLGRARVDLHRRRKALSGEARALAGLLARVAEVAAHRQARLGKAAEPYAEWRQRTRPTADGLAEAFVRAGDAPDEARARVQDLVGEARDR